MTPFKRKYTEHRYNAKRRNIDFDLTFDQWKLIWEESGQIENMGRKLGQYCMSRKGDIGPYSMDNVFIQLHSQNAADGHYGNQWNVGSKWSEERRAKLKNTWAKKKEQI